MLIKPDMDWIVAHTGELSSTICGLMWAAAMILFKKSGELLSPVVLNLFKGVVGLVLFVSTMLVLGFPLFPQQASTAHWLILLLSGAIGIGFADTLLFASLNRLGAGRMAIVDCLYSPLVILSSFIYLAEPIHIWLLVSMVLMAVAILVGTWRTEDGASPQDTRTLRYGVVLGMASQLLMAIGIVMAKPVLNVSDVWWATSVRQVGGLVILFVQGFSPRYRAEMIRAFTPSRQWKITIPAAVLGTYLAMIFWIMGMKYTYTTIASVLNQMSVIFMLIFATMFLKEPLTWRKAAAISIGFAAGVLSTL